MRRYISYIKKSPICIGGIATYVQTAKASERARRIEIFFKVDAWRVVCCWLKEQDVCRRKESIVMKKEKKIAVGTPNVFRRDIPLPNKTYIIHLVHSISEKSASLSIRIFFSIFFLLRFRFKCSLGTFIKEQITSSKPQNYYVVAVCVYFQPPSAMIADFKKRK